MCGRFSLAVTVERLVKDFQLTHSFVMVPRYNIAPSQVIPVIRTMGMLEFLHWGFKPSWMEPLAIKEGFVNARSETVTTKPAFRNAVYKRRCLIIVDGYYEWKRMGELKQPFYLYKKDRSVFALAGLWEGDTCTILTTAANEQMALVHERMPLIIRTDDYIKWLNPKADKIWVQNALLSKDQEDLMFHPVSTKMNSVSFEGAACIRAL